MKLATMDDMELGNLIFGNSRGTYLVEPREDYQNAFCEFLARNGFDMYGHHEITNSCEFENNTFIIRTYYWGEDEEIAALPNFVYKPTGLEINWYKYPMRDAYSNHDVDIETFKKILDDCAKSLKEGDGYATFGQY